MAKWGEGDPRWIVEEREDGVNVNNWHWREKNCTPWSVKHIQDLFKGTTLVDGPEKIVCTDNVRVEGDVTANNRKNKLILLYELEVFIDWKGTTEDGKEVTGKIEVPNLSDENDPDELEVNVSASKDDADARRLKELVRKQGRPVVIKLLTQYLETLKKDYCKDLILQSKTEEQERKTAHSAHAKANGNEAVAVKLSNGIAEAVSISRPAPTTTIKESYEFKCNAEDAYLVLTDPARVSAWVQSPVKLEARPGGEWALFGGNVQGKFIELVPNKKIVQTWRFASWPASQTSTVTITFEQGEDSTKVTLLQTDVPKSEAERVKEGWRANYWRRINSVFGYGADFGSF